MNFYPSKNLEISKRDLLLQHNGNKHYNIIQTTSSSTTVLNILSIERDVHFVVVQKDNTDIQRTIYILQSVETYPQSPSQRYEPTFPKLHKHIKRLEVINGVLRKIFRSYRSRNL